MTDPSVIRGGCLCGGVRFEVSLPTKWCAHCHCSLCRRAHGAAFVTWFGVERAQFDLLSGEDSVKWYQSTSPARRGFCPRCGSTLFFVSERWPDEVHIALAHMENAVDREPAAHVFCDSLVSWIELGDDLVRRGGPSGTEVIDSE